MPVIEDVQLLVTQIVAGLVKVNVVLRVRQAAPIAEMLVLIVVLYAEMLVETAVGMVAVHHVLLDVGMDAKVLVEIAVVKGAVFVKEVVAVDVVPVGDNVLMDVATDVIVLVVLLVIKDVVPVQGLVEMVVVLVAVLVRLVVAMVVVLVVLRALLGVEMDAIVLAEVLVIKDAQKLVILIVLILVKVNARDTVKGVVQMAVQKDAQLPLAFLQ